MAVFLRCFYVSRKTFPWFRCGSLYSSPVIGLFEEHRSCILECDIPRAVGMSIQEEQKHFGVFKFKEDGRGKEIHKLNKKKILSE